MAWQWSHTQSAYVHARNNVQNKDRAWLETVYAEWKAWDRDTDNLDENRFCDAEHEAKSIPSDVLADYIWDEMSEMATCDNGGWNAHACPFQCGCHAVPFSPELENASN